MAQLRDWCVPVAGVLIVAACADSTAPPPAARLAFTVQPSNAQAGAAIAPAVAVAIQDASGKTVTHAPSVVTVALGANSARGPLGGTLNAAAVNGIATFSDLHLDKAGTGYTLTAAAPGLIGAASAGFNVTSAAAAQLVFIVQPSAAMAGAAITPAVQVAAQDAWGNTATTFTGSVTMALGTSPGGATLTGTATVPAINGVASFSNLHLDKAGTSYTLTAAASGLTGTASLPFDIAPVPIIVFSSSRGIEGIQTDGSGRIVVIADSAVSDPSWSPDGAMLAFTRRSGSYPYTCDIYVADVTGAASSGVQRITSPLASWPGIWCAGTPSWSPDKTHIAFSVYGFSVPPGGAIYVVNADGSEPRQLVADPYSWFGYPGGPTWSPDGTQVAFDCGGGDITYYVCVLNADGSGGGTLTGAGGCEWGPAWSPTRAEIAFVGSCEDGGPYAPNGPFGIWLKNADGSNVRNLTDVQFGSDESPAWSPDGTQLVFARGYPADLYIINRDGTGLRQLTSTPDISEALPAWRAATAASAARHLAAPARARHGVR